jgi:hypothetical protein
VTFDFAASGVGTLAPGARVVIVKRAAAFAMRFGTRALVAGVYSGNLSNSGEALRVVDGAGADIASFTYDDDPPWPVTPDGQGPALVLVSPAANPASAASWRASYCLGGRPGEEDALAIGDWRARYFTAADLADPAKEGTLWGDLAIPAGDGVPNLLKYALGLDPTTNHVGSLLTPALTNGYFTATYPRLKAATGITCAAEVTGSLTGGWSSADTDVDQRWQVIDGLSTQAITARDRMPVGDATSRFMRLKVSRP